MQLTLYQIDAFTDSLFSGNPAAVVILNEWIDKKLMQNIAAENNLSETAFVKKEGERFEIRYLPHLPKFRFVVMLLLHHRSCFSIC